MNLDDDLRTVAQGHSVTRVLTLHMPESFVGTDKESLVRDICSMAIAGVACQAAKNLLDSHGIEGVVISTGLRDGA